MQRSYNEIGEPLTDKRKSRFSFLLSKVFKISNKLNKKGKRLDLKEIAFNHDSISTPTLPSFTHLGETCKEIALNLRIRLRTKISTKLNDCMTIEVKECSGKSFERGTSA